MKGEKEGVSWSHLFEQGKQKENALSLK